MTTFTIGDVKDAVVQALRLKNSDEIGLAVSRIVTNAKDLAAAWPWPELRGSGASLPANALGVVSVRAADGSPYWYLADRNERFSEDLAGKKVWSLSSSNIVMYVHNGTDWSSGSGTIDYWTAPACCSATTDATSVGLPSIRALEVRTILDLIDLMDRKPEDAQGWHQQLSSAMEELNKYKTPLTGPKFRTKTGRVLYLSPLYYQG